MGKSYKKQPITKDKGIGRNTKRIANKKVRRTKDFSSSGKAYKKLFESYLISDYKSYWPKSKAIERWYEEEQLAELRGLPLKKIGWHKYYNTLEEYLDKFWASCYKRK